MPVHVYDLIMKTRQALGPKEVIVEQMSQLRARVKSEILCDTVVHADLPCTDTAHSIDDARQHAEHTVQCTELDDYGVQGYNQFMSS